MQLCDSLPFLARLTLEWKADIGLFAVDPSALKKKIPPASPPPRTSPPRKGQAGTLRVATERDLRFQVHAETGPKRGHGAFRKPLARLRPPIPRTRVAWSLPHCYFRSSDWTAPPISSPEAATGPGSPPPGLLMWEKGRRSVMWSPRKRSPKRHVSWCPRMGWAHSTHSSQGISWPAGCPVLE